METAAWEPGDRKPLPIHLPEPQKTTSSYNDALDLARLRTTLLGTRFGGRLQYFPTVTSTNTLLLAAASEGAPDGTVFVADEQTAGRGRGTHQWHSSPGEGLYLSVLLRPTLTMEDALLLSLAAGMAVQHAVMEATGIELDIRWPNDLMVHEGNREEEPVPAREKKVGGILVETAVNTSQDGQRKPTLRYAVVGIGLNVHHSSFPEELATLASSLTIANRLRHDDPEDIMPLFRTPLLIALLHRLDFELNELERRGSKGRARLLARFAASSRWVEDIHVHVPEQGGYTGTTAGLDERGFLQVQCDDGQLRTVLSGGVRAL